MLLIVDCGQVMVPSRGGSTFFEFCAAEVFEPDGQGVISGMYMPLDYLEVFLSSDAWRGSQGGQYISYENAPRHINNSLFIELVQDGWIGSTIPDANTITDLIKTSLEGDRSVMLAAHRRDKDAETSNRARDGVGTQRAFGCGPK